MAGAELTRREFTLQADALSSSPIFSSDELRDRLRSGLGEHRVGRILDVACGPGLVCEALATEASAVVGIDLTPEMLTRAQARCDEAGLENVELFEASADAIPFEAGCFDAVVTRLAIHHFEEPLAMLREALRVLRPGGRLVVLDIVCSADRAEAELHNALERLRDPSHARMLAEPELLDAICEVGFVPGVQQSWVQQRSFADWASIVADARSIDALEPVMRGLAGAGAHAGIDLRVENDEVRFRHQWLLVAADRPAAKEPTG